MALPKFVKDTGGSFYKGYKLTVSAGTGDYVLNMVIASKGCAVNGLVVTCDQAGAGDYYKLEHFNSAGLPLDPDNKAIKNSGVIAETIFNKGKCISQQFDFVSLELFYPDDILRLTYTNVAGGAMNIFTDVERIK